MNPDGPVSPFNIGIGYAFLNGGDGDLGAAHVAEVYYRLAVAEHFGLIVGASPRRADDADAAGVEAGGVDGGGRKSLPASPAERYSTARV